MAQNRDLFIELEECEIGNYLIYTELNNNIYDVETVISSYSNVDISFELLNINDYPEVLQKIYISHAKKQKEPSFTFAEDGAPGCVKYTDITPEGYNYIYIDNKEKDMKLVEEVNYTKFEGLKFIKPFSGTFYKV